MEVSAWRFLLKKNGDHISKQSVLRSLSHVVNTAQKNFKENDTLRTLRIILHTKDTTKTLKNHSRAFSDIYNCREMTTVP